MDEQRYVEYFNEQKKPNIDEDFFYKVKKDENRFWVAEDSKLMAFLNKLPKERQWLTFRAVSCLQNAYHMGYCTVDWDGLLKMKPQFLCDFLDVQYKIIKTRLPQIIKEWDEVIKKKLSLER